MQKSNEQIALRVSAHTIIGNIVLSAFMLFAGLYARSTALLSESANTLSDVLSSMIVMIGVKMANKSSDLEHPYGHERMECVAAIVLAVLLLATGVGVGYAGVRKIMQGNGGTVATPGALALVAAGVSIAVKEAMYWYARTTAKKIDSAALMADALHHRSDVLSSVGSLLGVLGARLGFPLLDPIACIVICLLILKTAYDVFISAVRKMMDTSCDSATEETIRAAIHALNAEIIIDQLKTRLFGDKIYVDMEISVDGSTPLYEAHDVSERVHDAVEACLPNIKHCMVHVNPLASVGEDDA